MSAEKANTTIVSRNEVPVSDTWDLQALYVSESDWQNDYDKVKQAVLDADRYKGTLDKALRDFEDG